jgi:hypothetical protein
MRERLIKITDIVRALDCTGVEIIPDYARFVVFDSKKLILDSPKR